MRQKTRTERRLLKQAADRIERAGCDLCGITLGGPIPHHFGYIRDKMSGVCTGCIDGLDGRPCASGLFEIAPWLEDDRKWFRANPARTHRLREPVGEEVKAMTLAAGFTPPIPPLGFGLAIAVQRYAIGERVRQIVFLSGPVSSYTEAGIKSLIPWRQLNKHELLTGTIARQSREAKLSMRMIMGACNARR